MFIVVVTLVTFMGLYWTKLMLQRHIQAVSLLISGSQRTSLSLYSLLFFPGIVAHEISHFLVASFLNVRTGDITIFPDGGHDQKRVALGSVKVAKTDFIRGALVGAAPLIVGLILLWVLISWYVQSRQLSFSPDLGNHVLVAYQHRSLLTTILTMYAIWCLGNTLFMSKEDTVAWPVLIVMLILVSIFVGFAGFAAKTTAVLFPFIEKTAALLLVGLLAAVVVNLVMVTFFWCLKLVLEKLLHKRVIYH